ncbi:MAG: response regulator [Rickettsiales bacterium]
MREALKKILYVEDDEDIAELTALALSALGKFEALHCPSGEEALRAFSHFNPQLVLMDVMMPDMDGLETFERLRRLAGGKNAPVVFMTAKAQTHEQRKYRDMGAAGVIVKPCDPVELCRRLRRVWEEQGDG